MCCGRLNSLFETYGVVELNVALTALIIARSAVPLRLLHNARRAVVRPLPPSLQAATADRRCAADPRSAARRLITYRRPELGLGDTPGPSVKAGGNRSGAQRTQSLRRNLDRAG